MFNLKNIFKKKSSLKSINKDILDNEIPLNKTFGLCKEQRERKLIVSLTSFPERMHDIHYCLYSLLNQSVKPDKVILWLAQEQFPNMEEDIPKNVLSLRSRGLSIEWCENLYSYKKLIPALKSYENSIIVTADDDIFYQKNWLETLYNGYLTHPNAIICHRAHKIKLDRNKNPQPYKKWKKGINGSNMSFLNFFTGAGGVLYPPKSLDNRVTDIKKFTELAPKADDIWFWAMAILNNTRIYVVNNCIKSLTYINPERERGENGELTLFSTNKKGGNDIQLQNLLEYYPAIIEKIAQT